MAAFAAEMSRARAGDVLAEISVRNTIRPSTFHDEVFRFPGAVRDYSSERFYGWSFRERLASVATRVLEVSRARSSGAYLMATDLFANGLFSTMTHTVLMLFPRRLAGRSDPYTLRETTSGDLELLAPDGSTILVDGGNGAVLATSTFSVAPIGSPGTPPRIHHRGFHLEIHSVGRNPFLRGTPVRVADAFGGSCTVSTDELFLFGNGAESDVFRFDDDRSFLALIDDRCPNVRLPDGWQTASIDVVPAVASPAHPMSQGGGRSVEPPAW